MALWKKAIVMKYNWITVAKELQSIAQAGLTYATNVFDIERYQQIRNLSVKIMSDYSDLDEEKIRVIYASECGYQTPKCDVRAVVFRDNKILMVREMIDGLWTLPGGWCDVGLSPYENAVKEVREEAGIDTNAVRLLALFDKLKHTHPPDLFHVYKMFVLCEEIGGTLHTGTETTDVGFFDITAIPPLSEHRITKEQIHTMFRFLADPYLPVMCD